MTTSRSKKSAPVAKDESFTVKPDSLGMYAIRDLGSNVSDTPFFAKSDLMARRHFHMVAGQDGIVKSFLNEFDLVRLGQYNIITMLFEPSFDLIETGNNIINERK